MRPAPRWPCGLRSYRCAAVAFLVATILFAGACGKDEADPSAKKSRDSADAQPRTPISPATTGNDSPPLVTVDGVPFPVTTGAAAGYVPDNACRSCHESLYRRAQHVAMARSFYRPSTSNIIEDFENNHYYHARSKRHYEMAVSDGKFYQTRYESDPDGKRINQIVRQVDFVMGSGNNVRTYLYQTPSGELFELPLAWYSKLGAWRMNPGYDRPDHHGFNRTIDRECMFCHNAYPDVPDRSDEHGYAHLYPQNLPMGIGCQRCHGPGAEHIRTATSLDSDYADVLGSIVDPSRLSARLQDDVCFQCHLQPMLTPGSLIRIPGRGDFDYKPGEPLSDYLLAVDYEEVDPHDRGRFEINHHPYRLAQSPCYTKSDGGIRCTLCHDPHRVVNSEDRLEHFRAACLTCHAGDDCIFVDGDDGAVEVAHEPVDREDCVTCHMPKRRTQDVVHVAVTDHFIQRDPPRAAYLAPLLESEPPRTHPPFPYGRHRTLSPPLGSLLLEMFGQSSDLGTHTAKVEALVKRASPQGPYPYLYLAARQASLGDLDGALATYSRVRKAYPGNPASQSGAASVLVRAGRFRDAVAPLQRAIQLEPMNADAHAMLGAVLVEIGSRQEGTRQLREALRLKPNAMDPRFNLAATLTTLGRFDEAIAEFKELLAVDPSMTDAYSALGLLLIRVGKHKESIRYLRHAEASRRPDGEISLTLAIAYAESGDDVRAIEALDRATRFSADATDATLLRAVLAARAGQGGKAMFEQARQDCGPSGRWSIRRRRLIERGTKVFGRKGKTPGN